MKTYFTIKTFILIALITVINNQFSLAQDIEWRLGNQTYNSADPDAGGPATGSVTFTLQIHTVSATIPTVTAMTMGYSYQSLAAMLPTTTPCTNPLTPANTIIAPEFITAGFVYETSNQCNIITTETTGGQGFDRKTAGSFLSGPGITLTTTWKDVFTVTLWTLGSSFPQGGYVMINSGFGGTPGPIGTYGVSDLAVNEYIVNSLTYTTPLALGGTLPVLFTKFEAKCNTNGTLISWATAQEQNSNRFEIERSNNNGTDWKLIGTVGAAGNSNRALDYQQMDLSGGAALYRIKQIDNEGKFMYTAVERTNCQVKNNSSVIYPIPAYDVLNVVIKSDKAVKTQFMIYDASGKLMKRVNATIISGNNNFRIDLGGLIAGQYLIRTNDPAIEINKVFIIAR